MLTRLELTNFRCFRHQVFDFTQPRVLILGDNDKGKSTILDAVRWLMTGRCRGLDEGGKGVALLANDERKAGEVMSVSATMLRGEDQRTLTRVWDGKGSRFTMSGAGGQSGDQEAAFLAWIGVTDRRQLSVILDGQLFADMAHADAKELLMAFLPVEVVDPLNPERMLVPEEVDRLYAEAVTTRRDAKRDLAKMGEAVAPAEPVGDLDGARALLERLRGSFAELLAQRGEVVGAGQAKAAASRERLEQRVESLENQLGKQWAVSGAESLDEMRARVEMLSKDAGIAKTEHEQALAVLASVGPWSQSGDGLRADQLEGHDPAAGCVLCPDVPCKTTGAQFTKVAKQLRKKDEALVEQRERWQAASTAVRETESRLSFTLDQVRLAQERYATASDLDESLLSAKNELELLPAVDAVAEPSELDNQIAVLKGRIQTGTQVVADKEARQRGFEAYQRTAEKRQGLADIVNRAEMMVAAYGPGPDGVVSAAVASVRGRFEEQVNAQLGWFGFQFGLSVDPWGLTVNGRQWDVLAESVKFRASVALQIALAHLVGVSFTLIDRVDMLTTAHRRVLTGRVLACQLSQVIIAKASDPGPAPVIAGVQVITL